MIKYEKIYMYTMHICVCAEMKAREVRAIRLKPPKLGVFFFVCFFYEKLTILIQFVHIFDVVHAS